MPRISFPRADVQTLLDFSTANDFTTFGVAKDQGAYILSHWLKDKPKGENNVVVYAKGMNPDTDEDWYQQCRYKLGGDDFGCMDLPLEWLVIFLNDPAFARKKVLTLNITQSNISMVR